MPSLGHTGARLRGEHIPDSSHRVLNPGLRLQMADILLELQRHPRGGGEQGLLVGLNRRGGMGAVAPGDAESDRFC